MKNPHSLNNTWNRSINKDEVLMSVPGSNKKFKRKSQEPKKLYTGPESDRMKTQAANMSDVDSVDDTLPEACHFSRLAPLRRQLILSQEGMAGSTALLSGLPESEMSPAQGGAIDMRIGTNTQTGPSPRFPSVDIDQQQPPPQPPGRSLEPCLSAQALSMETQLHSPMDSPRKHVGGHHEVKAVQQTRRLLANARERTRVHTISAAFEALRKQVPCYSYGQKLSKLAILRIACNYILSLAQLAELDYSSDCDSVSFSQCVEQCTRTLQAEGRSKKRKAICSNIL
ncbi:Protein atonal like 8 [Dissostichus eleginoides]|uniref:Protein atonal homolog 8 n=1 Tax=Dissostichus eleginoides TaxID=100907 RepID=A0AAD9FIA3_DISEL|nr:Protein atonal like 8 [Dissostichus eleginoides]